MFLWFEFFSLLVQFYWIDRFFFVTIVLFKKPKRQLNLKIPSKNQADQTEFKLKRLTILRFKISYQQNYKEKKRARGKNKLIFFICVLENLGQHLIANTYTGGSFPDFLDPALPALDEPFVFTLEFDKRRPKGAFFRPFPPAFVASRSIFPDLRKLSMPLA